MTHFTLKNLNIYAYTYTEKRSLSYKQFVNSDYFLEIGLRGNLALSLLHIFLYTLCFSLYFSILFAFLRIACSTFITRKVIRLNFQTTKKENKQ